MPSKFNNFKTEFEEDTRFTPDEDGLNWEKEIVTYILYYKGRILDYYAGETRGRFRETTFKDQFKADTGGLEWDKNLNTYILYYRNCALELYLEQYDDRVKALEDRLDDISGSGTSLESFRITTNNNISGNDADIATIKADVEMLKGLHGL